VRARAGIGQVDLEPVREPEPPAGLDRHQPELPLEWTAGHSKQVAEDCREGQRGFARVECVAVTSEGPQGAAERRRLLENRDDVAEVREIHGRGEASGPGADDDDLSHDGGA
jgi:hypothetical protein